MIFAHTLDKVICGEKWQTRRLVKPDEVYDATTQRVVKQNNRTIYKVGNTYAVQPNRGKKSVARILLTDLRREKVSAISNSDAQAEGFASRTEFIAVWREIHGHDTDLACEVWVLEFKLVTIIANELKVLYGHRLSKNPNSHNSHDVPTPIEGLSGVSLHSRHHKNRRMDTLVSDRL